MGQEEGRLLASDPPGKVPTGVSSGCPSALVDGHPMTGEWGQEEPMATLTSWHLHTVPNLRRCGLQCLGVTVTREQLPLNVNLGFTPGRCCAARSSPGPGHCREVTSCQPMVPRARSQSLQAGGHSHPSSTTEHRQVPRLFWTWPWAHCLAPASGTSELSRVQGVPGTRGGPSRSWVGLGKVLGRSKRARKDPEAGSPRVNTESSGGACPALGEGGTEPAALQRLLTWEGAGGQD